MGFKIAIENKKIILSPSCSNKFQLQQAEIFINFLAKYQFDLLEDKHNSLLIYQIIFILIN